jgi:hypothetical protein
VRLLGHLDALQFVQGENSLKISMPAAKRGGHAFALEIAGIESSSKAKP